MRVVVAHREAATRQRLTALLTRVGHEVHAAAGAAAAVAACRAQPTDVALVAIDLCTDGGEDVLRAIKGDAEAFRTAVVLLERTDLDLDAAVLALRRGVQDFIVEPVGEGELVTRVAAAGRTKVLQEELVQQTRRLESLIFEDTLTGLANRRFILAQLGALVSGARRHGRPLSVAIVDIDRFKPINDVHGHQAGDRVLASVAACLRGDMRAEDHLGRLGGEEFLALLPDTDRDAAARVAEKLRCTVAASRVEHDEGPLRVTVSIGVATWALDEPAQELLRRADHALYAAKELGRDRTLSADPPLARATVPRRT